MNNVFISLAKKDEVIENFVKSKREELKKIIPGFVDDRKFTDIVLNFYERGIRDGSQMMLERGTKNVVDGICISNGAEYTRTDAFIEKACDVLWNMFNKIYADSKFPTRTIKNFHKIMKGGE